MFPKYFDTVLKLHPLSLCLRSIPLTKDKNETPNKIVIDCNIDHNDQPDILIQWFNKINSFVAYIISSNNYSAKMDHMLGSKVEGTIDRMLSKD